MSKETESDVVTHEEESWEKEYCLSAYSQPVGGGHTGEGG